MVMSRDQNSGQSHNIKTDNSSFEKVEEFKYLGTTLTNQNSILSSNLLCKSLKIMIHRTIFLLAVLYGCETWTH